MNRYNALKGFAEGGQQEKSDRERFLTFSEVKHLLDTIATKKENNFERDYACIFSGFYLALRVGECAILEKKHFRNIHHDEIYIPTLKQAKKIKVTCESCDFKYKFSQKRSDSNYKCTKCNQLIYIPEVPVQDKEIPEVALPPVETRTIEFLQAYLGGMRADQRYLFEGQHAAGDKQSIISPINSSTLNRIFGYWCMRAGLSNKYSWHSLRHGRGVYIWERFHDLVAVKNFLRQKSTSSSEFYMHLSPETKAKYREMLDKE